MTTYFLMLAGLVVAGYGLGRIHGSALEARRTLGLREAVRNLWAQLHPEAGRPEGVDFHG